MAQELTRDELFARLADPDRREKLAKARVDAVSDPVIRYLLQTGGAIDVSFSPKTKAGDYIISSIPEKQIFLVDAFWHTWIRSAGLTRKKMAIEMANGIWQIVPDGIILASWTQKYLAHHDFIAVYPSP